MTKTVSVIIPTFNRALFVLEAIKSIIDQSYPVSEIIIVDDASTDQTESTLVELKSKIPKIVYIKNNCNKGVAYSRNVGIRASKSELIAFLDSDDLWLPKKIEKQINSFELNPNQLLCHTNEKWELNSLHKNQSKYHQKQGGYFFERCLDRCLVSPSSVMLQKVVFEKYGLFDESLIVCEDYDLWLRLQLNFPFHFIDEILIIKRGGHQDQLSNSYHSMDIFRIKSLIKLINNNALESDIKGKILAVIIKKNNILKKGAIKHQNSKTIDFTQKVDNFISDQHTL